jgi:integrase
MIKSTRKRRKDKPAKPYPDFPLFPHQTKRWAKKIRGQTHYFGPWSDPDAALQKYLDQKDDLYARRKPRAGADGFTVGDLCNKFLNSKRHLVDTRELSQLTWNDYKAACVLIVHGFGKNRLVDDLRPDDFEPLRAKLAKKWGPVTLGNTIQRIRMVFRYAAENGLIAKPVLYGQAFKRPSAKALRKARNAKGPRMFEAAELRRLLAAATQPLKAMILLGINCGYGNSDCGKLPLSALDLAGGWATFPRPKTEIVRRCPLWPETVEAIKESLAERPTPKREDHAGLVFVTKYGCCWAKEIMDNPISKETAKLLKELGIHRPGLNFYALRHTFETIGGETDRQTAVDHIMGHAPKSDDMSAVYRERIGNDRLKAVTDHVREWLFAEEAPADAMLPFQQKKIG